MRFTDRLKHAWNALAGREDKTLGLDNGVGSSYPRYRMSGRNYNTSEFAKTVFNRISMDVAVVDILHVKIDPKNENQEKLKSKLQNCLTVEANIDQSSTDFFHDLVLSMFDEGVVAVVPVETTINPNISGSYDIETMRVGRITQWYPKKVEVELYDERDGEYKRVVLDKKYVAIIENPLYSIINEKNSTLNRLMSKMRLLDTQDASLAAGKLDMIIQLPYAVKSQLKREQAKERVETIATQLKENEYGIAYADATEKITQLNRPLTSNLLEEVKYLSEQFFNQIGLTQNVFDGTADESEMRSYYARTIDPIVDRIVNEFKRKFLTKTARSQGQDIVAYRDPFKLVPVEQLAQIADTFSRNAILTPNEVRSIVGFGPNPDPEADKLQNRNIAYKNQLVGETATIETNQNGEEIIDEEGILDET